MWWYDFVCVNEGFKFYSERAFPARIIIFPLRVMLVCEGPMAIPNDEEAADDPALVTDPSDAL
jgi:hypothetical protein